MQNFDVRYIRVGADIELYSGNDTEYNPSGCVISQVGTKYLQLDHDVTYWGTHIDGDAYPTQFLIMTNSNNLTLTGTGTLTGKFNRFSRAAHCSVICGGGTTTIDGPTIIGDGALTTSYGLAVCKDSGKLVVISGTLKSHAYYPFSENNHKLQYYEYPLFPAVELGSGATFDIRGGTLISSTDALQFTDEQLSTSTRDYGITFSENVHAVALDVTANPSGTITGGEFYNDIRVLERLPQQGYTVPYRTIPVDFSNYVDTTKYAIETEGNITRVVPKVPASYTITVNGGKAGTDNTGATVITSAKAGDKVYIFPTTPEGKEFNGWTVNAPSNLTLSETLPAYFTMPVGNVEVTANFKDTTDPQPTTYTITVNGGKAGTDNTGATVITSAKAGDKVYIFPTTPEGKEFNGWTVNAPSNLTLSETLPAYFTMPVGNVEVTANFKDTTDPQPGTITVTYEANGGTGSMATETLTADTDGFAKTYRFPECGFTAPAGKEFDEWEWAYTSTPTETNSAMPGNSPWLHDSITVKAIWKGATTITVTYDANGGTGTMAQETYTPDGSGFVKNFTVPECGFTAPAGKEFDHWENSNGTPYQVGVTPWIAESMILKAIWKDSTTPQPTTYTVSFNMNGHGDQIAAQTINAGEKATKPADPTAIGYMFAGWYKDSTFTTAWNFDTDTVTANTTLYALWTQNIANYTVSFNMNGHGNQIADQTVKVGEKATKPTDPTASGWTFNGWYADATFSVAFDFNTAINADTTVYAKWTQNTTPPTTTYTVSFNMNGHGNQVAAQTINAGEKANKPADPTASGWTFDGWYADATFSAAFDFNTAINADTTIYAKWTQNTTPPTTTYTIIAGANGEWTKGSTTGLAFTSDAPFDKFDSVKVDGSTIAATNYTAEAGSTKITLAPAYLETLSVGSHSIVVISTDGTASTNFTVKAAAQPPVPTTYTVTFNMNGHGTQITAQSVESGSKATKPANPTASGYTFGGWYADATFSTKFDFNSAITANTTVYAKWTKNSVTPTDPTSPQTGDNSNMFLWIALLFVSGGALVGTTVYGKKRKRAE